MSLFVCDECGCVENTALCRFWMQRSKDKKVLCSECDNGKWHNRFPKRKWDGKTKVINRKS